jgi:predicted nucleic acid-binding protein
MLGRDGVVERLQQSFTSGFLQLLPLSDADVPGICKWLSQYHSSGIQLADAALMYLAMRERCSTIFTLDHRHFIMMIGKSTKSFHLVPASY